MAAQKVDPNSSAPEPKPCAEKVVFETKNTAEAAALAADWQHGSSLKAYQCRYCQSWHLATSYKAD